MLSLLLVLAMITGLIPVSSLAAGEENAVGSLHIDKAGVIHQNQAGLILNGIETLGGIFQLAAAHAQIADSADNGLPEKAGFCGCPVRRTRQRHHLIIVHFFNGGLQKRSSSQ